MNTKNKKLTVSSVLIGSLFGSIHGGHYAFAYGPLDPRIKLHKFDEFLEEKEMDDRSIFSEKKSFLASRSKRIRAGPLLRSPLRGGATQGKPCLLNKTLSIFRKNLSSRALARLRKGLFTFSRKKTRP